MRYAVLALVLVGLVSCGGSSGDSSPITTTLSSDPSIDGYVFSTGPLNTAGAGGPGDNASGEELRFFYSFANGAIPRNAVVHSAVLRVHQPYSSGDPYGIHGPLMAVHTDIGDSLDSTDFTAPAIGTPVVLSTTSTQGWREVDVTAAVQNDLNVDRQRSQFRIQFQAANPSSNTAADYVSLEDAEGHQGSVNFPQLVVTYTVP